MKPENIRTTDFNVDGYIQMLEARMSQMQFQLGKQEGKLESLTARCEKYHAEIEVGKTVFANLKEEFHEFKREASASTARQRGEIEEIKRFMWKALGAVGVGVAGLGVVGSWLWGQLVR